MAISPPPRGTRSVAIPGAPRPELLSAYARALVVLTRARIRDRGDGDPAAADVLAAAGELAALRGAADFPVEAVLQDLGLDPVEREVVLFAAAVHLDPQLRDEIRARTGSTHVSAALVLGLLGGAMADAPLRRLLDPEGAAVRFGVVEIIRPERDHVASLLEHEIVATPRLLGLLAAELRSEPRLADVVRWHRAAASEAIGLLDEDDYRSLALTVAAAARALRPSVLVIEGAPGTGRLRLARALAVEVRAAWVIAVDSSALPRAPRELLHVVDHLDREARFLGAMLVFRDVDDLASGPIARALVAALRRVTAPVVCTCSTKEIDALEPVITLRTTLKRPSPSLRAAAWRHELAARELAIDGVDELAADFPLSRGAIGRSIELASAMGTGPVDAAALRAAAATQVYSRLMRYAERVRPRVKMDDLVLPEDMIEQVKELIHAVRTRAAIARRWQSGSRLTISRGIAALFNGPPGTGKTLTATVLAAELDMPIYRINVATIVDRYVGETEKNLARIFEEAESDRAVLLFDEADSLFSKRVEVKDSHDRYANMQVNMLLNLIEEYSGFVVLTTNLKSSIDTAFLRRVAFKMNFELPEIEERTALWRMHLHGELAIAPGLDIESIAREYRTSGGEIRNAVFRASLMAGDHAITEEMLRRAVRYELEAAGNVVRDERRHR